MVIIEDIDRSFFENKKIFLDNSNAYSKEIDQLTKIEGDKTQELERRRVLELDAPDALKDIKEFAEMVHISPEEIPFSLDDYETQSIKDEIKEIGEKKKEATIYKEMYDRYLRIMQGGYVSDIVELRRHTMRYIPEYEWLIDADLINSCFWWLGSDHLDGEHDHRFFCQKYKDVLKTLTMEYVKSLGHPFSESDKGWGDGTADLVLAVFRVPFEYKYLCHLKEEMEDLRKRKERKLIKQKKQSEQTDIVIPAWEHDTSAIEKTTHKDSIFYKSYKNVITDEVKKDIDTFINGMKI